MQKTARVTVARSPRGSPRFTNLRIDPASFFQRAIRYTSAVCAIPDFLLVDRVVI